MVVRPLTLRRLKFSVLKDYFGLITGGTFVLGYIGFYSYTARYSLPFVHPEVSQVVAMGIASWIALVLFYLSSGGRLRRRASSVQSLLLFLLLSVLVNELNPLFLFVGVYAYIDQFEEAFLGDGRSSFKKVKRHIINYVRYYKVWNFIITASFMAIGLFWSLQLFIEWAFIDTAIRIFRRLRFGIFEGYKVFLILLLTPIFLFGLFMADKDYTLLGLANSNVIMTKKDGSKFKARLLYRDDNYFYLEDSASLLVPHTYDKFAPDIKTSVSVAKDEIVDFRIDTATQKKEKPKSVIQILKWPPK